MTRVWKSDNRRRFARNRVGLVSAILLVVLIVILVIGPFFSQDPDLVNTAARIQAPSSQHLLGTDQLGRDVLARIIAGGRISLFVAVAATILALAISIVIGTVAGYRGGLFDAIVSRVFDIFVTFPTLLVGIILAAAFQGSLKTVIAALTIGQLAVFGRLFRIGTISVKSREYIQSVIAMGIPPFEIVVRNILPNVVIPVVIIATGQIGRLAVVEASLSFIGAGVQPPTASWGNMISGGEMYLQIAPWIALIPGVVLVVVSLGFSFVGDALRDAFDVRESVVASAEAA
jgi:peptide/nickel transport system permease protein